MSTDNKDTASKKVRILGVCGGIGSGKSKACELLVSELGCVAHIEADSIAHKVYQPGSQTIKDVVERFGTDILQTGKPKGEEEIDRKKLGAIVFSDPDAMATLERIVWPHVRTKILARIEEIKQEQQNESKGNNNDDNHQQPATIVLESAVLLDAEWEDLLDGIWLVRVPHTVAIQRLVQYRNFSEEDAQKRIEAQQTRRGIGNADEEVEKGVVTAIIENTGEVEELQKSLQENLHSAKSWK
ncbi:Dephospho-CoA kinase [Seminavis robusta]|uniref:Dephospho-CoA kinase n=1 Tax=Seminavis robusta TaxID=568900 RepID=A0A9N8ERG5_9STRA|nr:Dephospho-CoA kinase [Seminavis robusta]|eukprot:Sro1747_g295010.1 Dephospho-CoA kinase (242) ;mRNA; f:400-1358